LVHVYKCIYYKLKMNPGNKVVIEIMASEQRNSWPIDNMILFCIKHSFPVVFSFDFSSYFHTASIYTTNRQHQTHIHIGIYISVQVEWRLANEYI